MHQLQPLPSPNREGMIIVSEMRRLRSANQQSNLATYTSATVPYLHQDPEDTEASLAFPTPAIAAM